MSTQNKYITTNLGSISKVQTGPFGSQLHEKDYVEKGTPIITVEHLGYGRIIKNDIPCVSESDALRLKKFTLKTGDIVFSRVGSVDRSVLIGQAEDGWMFSGRCLRVRVITEAILPTYLYYYFTQNSFRQYVRNNAVGATMPSLNSGILRRLTILYPSITKQKEVNEILSAIDEKLSNNHARIQLLEESARLLYREWFVYLRFPGHEKVKRVNGLPDGWKKVKFNDYVDFKEGPGLRNTQYRESGVPFLNIRTIEGDDVDLTKVQYIDETEALGKYKHFLLQDNDLVVSSSGTLGRVVTIRQSHLPLMLNTSLIRMRPKNGLSRAFLKGYLKYGTYLAQVSAMAIGAAQSNYGPLHLNKLSFVLPSFDIIEQYDKFAENCIQEIKALLEINLKLAQARDLLLPRLMDGRIEV